MNFQSKEAVPELTISRPSAYVGISNKSKKRKTTNVSDQLPSSRTLTNQDRSFLEKIFQRKIIKLIESTSKACKKIDTNEIKEKEYQNLKKSILDIKEYFEKQTVFSIKKHNDKIITELLTVLETVNTYEQKIKEYEINAAKKIELKKRESLTKEQIERRVSPRPNLFLSDEIKKLPENIKTKKSLSKALGVFAILDSKILFFTSADNIKSNLAEIFTKPSFNPEQKPNSELTIAIYNSINRYHKFDRQINENARLKSVARTLYRFRPKDLKVISESLNFKEYKEALDQIGIDINKVDTYESFLVNHKKQAELAQSNTKKLFKLIFNKKINLSEAKSFLENNNFSDELLNKVVKILKNDLKLNFQTKILAVIINHSTPFDKFIYKILPKNLRHKIQRENDVQIKEWEGSYIQKKDILRIAIYDKLNKKKAKQQNAT